MHFRWLCDGKKIKVLVFHVCLRVEILIMAIEDDVNRNSPVFLMVVSHSMIMCVQNLRTDSESKNLLLCNWYYISNSPQGTEGTGRFIIFQNIIR
jgi:hypothetical protein